MVYTICVCVLFVFVFFLFLLKLSAYIKRNSRTATQFNVIALKVNVNIENVLLTESFDWYYVVDVVVVCCVPGMCDRIDFGLFTRPIGTHIGTAITPIIHDKRFEAVNIPVCSINFVWRRSHTSTFRWVQQTDAPFNIVQNDAIVSFDHTPPHCI